MTKKNYESLEARLNQVIKSHMSRPIEAKGTHGKAVLQDIVKILADELGAADKKFNRQDFYWKTGALEHLSNG